MATVAGTQVAIEYENWLRIVTLVHYGGREVCLDILHQKEGLPFDGNQLYLLLQNKLPEFQKLLKNKKIKQNQYDLIFPANQITNTAEFDITLFTLVISVLYGNKYKLIIGELRKWRNGEFHKGNILFTPLEFNTTWTDITTLLGNHGLNLSLVADLRTCVLDAQSVFRNAYLEALALRNSLDIAYNKHRIVDNEKSIDDNKKRIDNNEQRIDETESRLSEVEGAQNQFSDVKKKVDELTKETESQAKYFRFMVHETASNFFGRKELLNEIHEKFSLDTHYHYNAVVLTGLGGIGKSQTAAQYAFLHEKTFYDATIWLDVLDIEGSLCSLLDSLKVQCPQNKSVQVLTQLFCQKLRHQKCLIILDDASNKKSLDPILKNLNFKKKPSVLITSQNDKWKMSRIHQIRVDVFTQNEAEQFLLKELKEQPSDAIPELVDVLQSFPLAMQQAVCYMKVNNMQIIKYLEYFKSNNKKLLDISIDDYGVTEYDKTLLTVWELAFEKLQENQLAVQVIGMIAYMDHRFINKKTFLQVDGIDDEVMLNEVIELLCEYSLLTLTQNNYLKLHLLVQKILRFRHQERKDCFVLLKSLLMKLSDVSAEFDTDEDNLWFPHFRKLFYEKDYDTMKLVLKSSHFQNVAINRSDVPLHTSILYITSHFCEENYHSEKSLASFERLLIKKSNLLNTLLLAGKLKDCHNIISEFKKKYLHELKNASMPLYLWKMLVVQVLIKSNQHDKISYPSPPIERLSWKDCSVKIRIYEKMIINSTALRRSEEALLLCQELMQCRFPNPIQKYTSVLQVTETFCLFGYYRKAARILQELNDRDQMKLPENHQSFYYKLHVDARINAGLGNFEVALSLIEKLRVSLLNNGQYLSNYTMEKFTIQLYIKVSEYKKSESLLENQLSNHVYLGDIYLLVFAKLFLRKFEEAVELLKKNDMNPYPDLCILSRLYMTLYKNFEEKRSNSTIEEANEALSYVIALQKDLIERFVFP